jgi:hypothetical protein
MKEEVDELEMEEFEDEADGKPGGPSEVDIKVLCTYITYGNVFG